MSRQISELTSCLRTLTDRVTITASYVINQKITPVRCPKPQKVGNQDTASRLNPFNESWLDSYQENN